MDQEHEIASLNIRNLDIRALEQRLELAAGLAASPDGWVCGADCASHCTSLCDIVCEEHCGSFCPAVCSIDACGVNCAVVVCNTNSCDQNS